MKADRHRQDIYSSQDYEEKSTNQASSRTTTQREREIRRQRITSILIFVSIVGVVVGLTYFIIMWQQSFQDDGGTVRNDVGTKYLSPAGTDLNDETDWVRDYPTTYADPTWDGVGERPFSAQWIKKAAYNLHWAETATKMGKNDKEALKSAAKYYEQALEIFPDIEDVKAPLANIYLQLERYEEAIVLFENIPEKELTHNLLNNLGIALTTAGKYEQAETCLMQALEKQPDYAAAMRNLATLYKEQNIPAKAIDAYERYLTVHKDDANAPSTRNAYGLYMIQIKDWKRAAEQFRILTEELPGEAINYKLLAEAEKQLGNTAAALAALERFNLLTDSSSE
ncbi:MAG: tetratricopeptide repeat protein [Pontiellaceae bacterium]|nr:tetratricopeptide repeat protein [Pontiellaceae bacterium]